MDVKIGFNPDSFGHAAGLPTILSGAGYRKYVFMRPQEQEMDLPLLFWWEGPDGSLVLTLRIWKTYDAKARRSPMLRTTYLLQESTTARFFWVSATMGAL